MASFTERNIEDWDFRGIEPGSEADLFLDGRYLRVVGIDSLRTILITGALEDGLVKVTEDREYVVPVSDGEFYRAREGVLSTQRGTFTLRPDDFSDSGYTLLKEFTKGRFRDSFTSDGRWDRRIRRSLWREWKKYGRIKVRLLPNEEEKQRYGQMISDGAAVYREWHVEGDA